MRVGLIAPPWLTVPPTGYGGTEAVVDHLARGLASAGHDVELVATGDSTCPVATTWVHPKALGFPTGATPFELRHVLHAYDALGGCDVIHDHTVVGPLLSPARPGPPVVWTNHGPFDAELTAIFSAGRHRAAAVVAISRAQAGSWVGGRVDAVIHHGIELDRFPVGDGGGGYVLALTRMTPSKGVAAAIDVARSAGVPLVLAAKMREPDERAYFEAEVRPRLGPGIDFVGEVGPDERVRLLGDAQALLNPIAWDEPFGLVMIEALACGTPVIATRRGAAPEIVADGVTGFLGRTRRELVAGLGAVDRLDRAACRARALQHFSDRRMVEEHLALYRRVAGVPVLLAGDASAEAPVALPG